MKRVWRGKGNEGRCVDARKGWHTPSVVENTKCNVCESASAPPPCSLTVSTQPVTTLLCMLETAVWRVEHIHLVRVARMTGKIRHNGPPCE